MLDEDNDRISLGRDDLNEIISSILVTIVDFIIFFIY